MIKRPADLLKLASNTTPEFKQISAALQKVEYLSDVDFVCLDDETAQYVDDYKYEDDLDLVAFNTVLPAIEIALKQTQGADKRSAVKGSDTDLEGLYDFTTEIYQSLVILGYVGGAVSYDSPSSPLKSAPAMRRRNPAQITKEMDKEFKKSVTNARVFNFLNQNTLTIFLSTSFALDNVFKKEFPILSPIVGTDEGQYTIGRDALVLLGLGSTLAFNDILSS